MKLWLTRLKKYNENPNVMNDFDEFKVVVILKCLAENKFVHNISIDDAEVILKTMINIKEVVKLDQITYFREKIYLHFAIMLAVLTQIINGFNDHEKNSFIQDPRFITLIYDIFQDKKFKTKILDKLAEKTKYRKLIAAFFTIIMACDKKWDTLAAFLTTFNPQAGIPLMEAKYIQHFQG